ncbi:MAG: ABC transporter ATP-binding protein [Geminicoccaceae bacterium]
MTGEALSLDRIETAYGSTLILKGVSLAVEPGEFVALLGSSGCGKTTLLRAISGFVNVRAGRIQVGERDITHLPPEKRDMAMVFQSYALWPHMTTADNIAYGLRLRGINSAERRRRVQDVLAMLGLDGLGERAVTALSGGQRQRVALGRALAINPRILLLDEPLSNLDARIRHTVRHEIKALQQQLGITTIHVTHDREEAMIMADRLVVMEAGEIRQVDTPEVIYNRPASPFVAAFMGADNVIWLDIRAADGGLQVEASEHSDAVLLPLSDKRDAAGIHVEGAAEGRKAAHFRSEAATMLLDDQTPSDSLVLRGVIRQSTYPGGFYRYAVDIGDERFMVDDQRRFDPGEKVRVALSADALSLFSTTVAEGENQTAH